MGEETDCPKPVLVSGRYGPFDYTDPEQRGALPIVEIGHFTPEVASLRRGNTSYVWDDLQYTLTAFPNHHRALQSLADLAIREKTNHIGNMKFTVPCYFIRAIKFVPNDGMVNAIYAYYLAYIGQKDFAKTEAEQAIQKKPNDPRVAYEVGLAYFYMGDHKMASDYSSKAKKLGSTAIGLDKLLSQPQQTKDLRKPEGFRDH